MEETNTVDAYNPDELVSVKVGDELQDVKKWRITNAYVDNERYAKRLSDLRTRIHRVEEYLQENYDDLELHADEIAELLDITLTREVTMRVTLEVEVVVEVPAGKDVDDIGSDLSFAVELDCDVEGEVHHVSVESWNEA